MNNRCDIVQWNCRGLKPNYNEILLLLSQKSPSVMCLQETFLKESDNISFKNYSINNCIAPNANRACGGASIIVNNRVPHRVIKLSSNLQAVAVSVTLHKVITICSVYIPPCSKPTLTELDNLVEQLPKPFIILGDLNGHHTLWGCKDINDKGELIEQFIDKHQTRSLYTL